MGEAQELASLLQGLEGLQKEDGGIFKGEFTLVSVGFVAINWKKIFAPAAEAAAEAEAASAMKMREASGFGEVREASGFRCALVFLTPNGVIEGFSKDGEYCISLPQISREILAVALAAKSSGNLRVWARGSVGRDAGIKGKKIITDLVILKQV